MPIPSRSVPVRPEADTRPKLIIVSSLRARNDPSSPLLRFVRDYSRVLNRYQIHTTEETAAAILGCGMYGQDDVRPQRAGADGGIAQLAAIAARGECSAAILFLDPSDLWSDAVENRALTRVCIQHHVRLVTTYVAALRWATYEANLPPAAQEVEDHVCVDWKPRNWLDGIRNVTERHEFKYLPIEQRSIALISHDKKKLDMVKFLNKDGHLGLLARYQRILATGTTGWLLKLLFCTDPKVFQNDVETRDLEGRLSDVVADMLEGCSVKTKGHEGYVRLLDRLRSHLATRKNDQFANKIIPLPSGPNGGDVLIADEVLRNACHEIIFFHDPLTAHPHNDDIRLLERTCRLPGVFAECVSDSRSAERWMEGLSNENSKSEQLLSLAQTMRQEYKLKEVILVDTGSNQDSNELGSFLARACAGFLNQWLHVAGDAHSAVRVGVAWGWGMKEVLTQLQTMMRQRLLDRPRGLPDVLVWSPIIGIITAEMTDEEASMIAEGLRTLYGGSCEGFQCAGFASENARIPKNVADRIEELAEADLIVTSASAWNRDASLAMNTGLNRTKLPDYTKAIATISGVFLAADGSEVRGEYSIVGLGYDGLRKAASDGRVVVMCGGRMRNPVVLSVLRGRLVSVLITTRQTAEWVLEQAGEATVVPSSHAEGVA